MTITARLDEVAELNPRLKVRPESDAVVSFLGMADVNSDGSTSIGMDRPFGDTAKGYTQFRRGDVLVAKITPCFENGKIAQAITRHLLAAGSTEFHIVRPNLDLLDGRYLHHYLRQPLIRIDGERRMTGSAGQRRVPESYLAQLKIPLPPLDEQQRIAALLDQADKLTSKRRQAVPLLDDLARATFLDMFGDPLINPQNWPISTIGQLLSVKPCYGTMIPPSKQEKNWLCLRVANIQDWNLTLQDTKFVDLGHSDIERHSVVDGDMILARAIATEEHLGKAVIVYPGTERWAFDSHIMRLRFDQNKVVPEFVREAFRTPGGRKLFLSATRRSAVQYNINTKEISGLHIPLPPMSLQNQYLEQVRRINELRKISNSGLARLDEFFSSLQVKAFHREL